MDFRKAVSSEPQVLPQWFISRHAVKLSSIAYSSQNHATSQLKLSPLLLRRTTETLLQPRTGQLFTITRALPKPTSDEGKLSSTVLYFETSLGLIFVQYTPLNTRTHFIHSFIHCRHLYSASSSGATHC